MRVKRSKIKRNFDKGSITYSAAKVSGRHMVEVWVQREWDKVSHVKWVTYKNFRALIQELKG